MGTGYDTHIEWPTAELAALISAGVIQSGDRVLDLACGLGTESLFLGAMGCEVLAIDSDKALLRQAAARRDDLPVKIRRRVEFKHADVRDFREGNAGTFRVASERLLLQNLSAVGQLRVIRTAAYALEASGVFVIRVRPEGDDDEPEDIARDWGVIDEDRCSLEDRALDLLHGYFDVGRPVKFGALITDPTLQESDVMTIRAISMVVIVARRNDRPMRARKT